MIPDNPSVELPRYKCHKEVRAVKIRNFKLSILGAGEIIADNPLYASLPVDQEYVSKHWRGLSEDDIIGGYYVVYDDGYKSFSPAKAFEEGYTLIEGQ